MSLAKDIERFKQIHCDDGCLSIYLRTSLSSTDQQKGEWKIRLKNGLKKLEEYLEASENDAELKSFKRLKKLAEKNIKELSPNLPKSIVFIGSASGDLYVKKLQVPVENDFRWEHYPVVDQLENLEAKYPLSGIVMIQKTDVLAVETSLGEVNDELHYAWDVEAEDWKEYIGARPEGETGAALHRESYANRFDANQQRWFKKIANKIEKQARKRNWQTIHVVGSPDQTTAFVKQCSTADVAVLKKNLAKLKAHEIVREVNESAV
ncbi:VLRF1 family aeRF1-type release factor [Shouchella clausii]|uniref:VLRF1 family aeRF1-type release factor n=1 Tax=Shouchella clausii TaxID=79880 RepID=UPI000D99C099|nr:VLRF1 family aeRF1-type release factor [Shouchella clausii]SPU21851.1 YocB protein [Niallia circulans]MCM3551184.1 VLRF1 family aeRF1-type release factor [Shouchella clausii]MEB5479705.1 VLRF1 family aeRF1-type release factor [Shouchella clausii]MED4160369.1 VLRF1 family aeRF1-type release factor [Shouchella clausii]MED4178781.1 VLRF1 family aeRF1-type release factor [Shouchella clausii]